MIEMLICCAREKEASIIELTSKDMASFMGDQTWNIRQVYQVKDAAEYMKKSVHIDIVCMDITLKYGISLIEKYRQGNPETYILIIADTSISPMEYMKPSIMASSLILRPFNLMMIKNVLNDLIRHFHERLTGGSDANNFVVNMKGEIELIPYSKIIYFEAKDKKICLNTKNREIVFYETISNLEKELPEEFLRCHRSFIINKQKIQKVANNELILSEGTIIPISRSYKAEIKEFVSYESRV